MRLRVIAHMDFRKNEHTLYNEVMESYPKLRFKTDDCVCMISGNGKIVRFVFGFTKLEALIKRGKVSSTTQVLSSRVHRITGYGIWNPLMLQNYANAVGLEIEGLKSFAQYYRQYLEEKREVRAGGKKKKKTRKARKRRRKSQ